jgi:hypothetical protein
VKASELLCTLVLAAAIGFGCGKDDPVDPSATATSTSTGGSTGMGGSAGAGGEAGQGGAPCEQCNCLANDAAEITWVQLDQDMPQPGGGIIRIGVYWLTEVTLYTGVGGATGPLSQKWKMAIEFVGPPKGPVADVVVDRYQGMGEERYSFGYQPDDGGAIAFSSSGNPLCEGSVSVPWNAYTYTDGDPPVLTLYAGTSPTSKVGFKLEQQSSPDGTGGMAGSP